MKSPRCSRGPRPTGPRPSGDGSNTSKPGLGALIYVLLVAVAYFSGRALPSVPKEKPLPTSSRTICTHPPTQFDTSLAQGKTVLILGAAGFIGSHVARCADVHLLPLQPDIDARSCLSNPFASWDTLPPRC